MLSTAHEHLILLSLEDTKADGLLLSPVIDPKKPGDFLTEPILNSYQTMLDVALLPSDRTVLGGLATYPRYAGPREAVFTALCRNNMGCNHFIVGRDHTGVGGIYSSHMTRDLFERLGDSRSSRCFTTPSAVTPGPAATSPSPRPRPWK